MALTVQDDTGLVSGANAYITVAYADAYFTDRNNEAWVDLDDEVKEAAILQATSYIDYSNMKLHKGIRKNEAQSTEWPRNGAYDENGYEIAGLPECLKQATAEYANRARASELAPDPTYDSSGIPLKSKSEKIGPITESYVYQDGFTPQNIRKYPYADMLLSPILNRSGFVLRG